MTTTDEGFATYPPQFVSSAAGFMLGVPGGSSSAPTPVSTLLVTTDGGATWIARPAPGVFPTTSFFVNADDGWLTDQQGALYATEDAGRTWTDLRDSATLGLSLDFVTPQTGWAATEGPDGGPPAVGFLQTTDGGRTWTSLTPTISQS